MGKRKKRRALEVAAKQSLNPFDTRHSKRSHHNVVNPKRRKTQKPTVPQLRARSLQLRQETLAEQAQAMEKRNVIVDRRLGEKNPRMSEQDRALLRFRAERLRQASRTKSKGKYNLSDGEEEEGVGLGGETSLGLTHGGQLLEDYEPSDGEQSGEEDGFGEDGLPHKERRHRIEELRAPSQRERQMTAVAHRMLAKQERAKQKDVQDELLEQLDTDFDQVRGLVFTAPAGKEDEEVGPPKPLKKEDSWAPDTQRMRMLAGQGVSKAELEAALRIVDQGRNQGEYGANVKALAFEARAQAAERRKTAADLAKEERARLVLLERQRRERMLDQELGVVSEGELEEESEEEEEEEKEGKEAKRRQRRAEKLAVKKEMKRLKEGEDEVEALIQETPLGVSEEIPFVFPAPSSVKELETMLHAYPLKSHSIVLERIRTCHSARLDEESREKMHALFTISLEYLEQVCAFAWLAHPSRLLELEASLEAKIKKKKKKKKSSSVKALQQQVAFATKEEEASMAAMEEADIITKHLFVLVREIPVHAVAVFKEALSGMKISVMPSVSTLLLLRMVFHLFPVSDFQHPIATPCFLRVGQLLTHCPVVTRTDVVRGWFLCSIALDHARPSERWMAETPLFLCTTLQFLSNIPMEETTPIFPLPWGCLRGDKDEPWIDSLEGGVSLIAAGCQLLRQYVLMAKQCAYSPALPDGLGVETTNVLDHLMSRVPSSSPLFALVETTKKQVVADLQQTKQQRTPLQLQRHKPIPLEQFAPRFEKDFNPRKDYDADTNRAQAKRLRKAKRREMRGAIRELRKDAQFVQMTSRAKQMEEDSARKEKLKSVMSILQQQQADMNVEYRKSKRGKGK